MKVSTFFHLTCLGFLVFCVLVTMFSFSELGKSVVGFGTFGWNWNCRITSMSSPSNATVQCSPTDPHGHTQILHPKEIQGCVSRVSAGVPSTTLSGAPTMICSVNTTVVYDPDTEDIMIWQRAAQVVDNTRSICVMFIVIFLILSLCICLGYVMGITWAQKLPPIEFYRVPQFTNEQFMYRQL